MLLAFAVLSRSKNQATTLCSLLRPFLTLEEAEAIEHDTTPNYYIKHLYPSSPTWKPAVLVLVALVETAVWTFYGCYALSFTSDKQTVWPAALELANAATWTYAAVRPILRRRVPTPTYDLWVYYLVRLLGVVVSAGALVFGLYVYGEHPENSKLARLAVDAAGVFLGLGVISSYPMGVPSEYVDPKEITHVRMFALSLEFVLTALFTL